MRLSISVFFLRYLLDDTRGKVRRSALQQRDQVSEPIAGPPGATLLSLLWHRGQNQGCSIEHQVSIKNPKALATKTIAWGTFD